MRTIGNHSLFTILLAGILTLSCGDKERDVICPEFPEANLIWAPYETGDTLRYADPYDTVERVVRYHHRGDSFPQHCRDIESGFVPSFSTKKQGTDNGLSLCRQIVQLHWGAINASSLHGKETVMEITLPL